MWRVLRDRNGVVSGWPPPGAGVWLLDLERGESLGRFWLDGDVFHLGQAGAGVRPGHEAADVLVWSLEDRFDPAVGEVAYPAGHAAALSQPTAGVAEEDALDPAGDQYPIANHKQTVRGAGGRDGNRGDEPPFVRSKECEVTGADYFLPNL
jgi:hypothetical protein